MDLCRLLRQARQALAGSPEHAEIVAGLDEAYRAILPIARYRSEGEGEALQDAPGRAAEPRSAHSLVPGPSDASCAAS
jgi:hypothetical protein